MTWLQQHRIAVKYVVIGAALVGGLVALERAGVLAGWAQSLDPIIEGLAGMGVLGAFLLGLLGNSSLLLQVPYTVPMLSAALAGAPLAYLLALAVAAGVGATLGELVSYAIADVILRRQPLSGSALYRWVDRTVREHPRSIPWLVLLFAVTMLPDDAVLIPLAMLSYGAWRLMVPLLLGKLGYCVGSALVFHVIGERADAVISAHATADLAVVGLVVFFLVICCQVESARAGSVTSTESQEVGSHGSQDPHRTRRRLRPRHRQRG